MKPLPSVERLRELLDYNPVSGEFRWRWRSDDSRSFNQRQAGKLAGNVDVHGYRRITVDGQKYWAHRIAWWLMTGQQPAMIDHINGNRDSNNITNLRATGHAENLQNRGAGKNSKTGVKGVHFSKAAGRYTAQICVNRKRLTLGLFDTIGEAAAAYSTAAARLHGEFANDGRQKAA